MATTLIILDGSDVFAIRLLPAGGLEFVGHDGEVERTARLSPDDERELAGALLADADAREPREIQRAQKGIRKFGIGIKKGGPANVA